MNIRESIEVRERVWLAAGASLVTLASRPMPESEDDLRTAFQRDRDRILHSKAFRRLKDKTQVFIAPEGDHFRTRLTHTLEVTQIARTIARALRLNEDLTEAIGMGHDLGHTPFGHTGERALARLYPGFRHNEQSLRVVDRLEKDGRGLNLTNPVRDGILRHSKPDASIAGEMAGTPQSAEAQIVKVADGIAYINHDFDDAVRGGLLAESDLPRVVTTRLGTTHAARINTLVHDVVATSAAAVQQPFTGETVIRMSADILETTDVFRNFLFERVYVPLNQTALTLSAEAVIAALFDHLTSRSVDIPDAIAPAFSYDSPERRAADIISGMTDRYALRYYELNLAGTPGK